MSDGVWTRKPNMEDWTRTDWFLASQNLTKNAYNKERRIGRKAGLDVPTNTPFTADFVSNNDTDRLLRSDNKDAVRIFNDRIKAWGNNVVSSLRSSVQASVKDDKELSKSIKIAYKYRHGEMISIGFSFSRHGAYLLHGAGKNYGGDGSNTSWLDKYGTRKKAKQESLYKAGTGRKAIGWYNPVISANVDELANIIAEYSADISLNLSHVYINTHFEQNGR